MTTFTQNVPSPPPLTLNQITPPQVEFKSQIKTTSPLESKLFEQDEFCKGLNWGVPRFGHPEGKVGFHVKEVLSNIEQLGVKGATYQRLRLTALTHDTFKYQECDSTLKGKRINHGLLARRFTERFIDDEATLDLIELHDEIYFSWRHEALHGSPEKATKRLEKLMHRIGDHLKLHYLFFRSDTMTGDKIQAPRYWFEQKVRMIGGKEFDQLFARLNNNH